MSASPVASPSGSGPLLAGGSGQAEAGPERPVALPRGEAPQAELARAPSPLARSLAATLVGERPPVGLSRAPGAGVARALGWSPTHWRSRR